MAVECQLSPFSVSPTALMADSLSSCDPAQHRHFLFFYHRRAMYIRWKKRKKMPRAILRFITLSQTDQRSFCTHPPAIQCLCSDVLGATQNHFDVFQSVNKETMIVPPFARLSRKKETKSGWPTSWPRENPGGCITGETFYPANKPSQTSPTPYYRRPSTYVSLIV